MVDLRTIGNEAVFLDQVASEYCESIPVEITMKDRAEDVPEDPKGVRGRAARPVLHAYVHHAANEQGK